MKANKYPYIVGCIVPLLFFAQTASSQQGLEQAAIYVGPFDVTPTIAIDVRDDDNIFSQVSGQETSSTLTIVKPQVSAVADDGVMSYELTYQLENGTYSDTSDSDYTDHEVGANIIWRADIRHLIELNTAYAKGHDGRSPDGVTALTASDLDEFDDKTFALKYVFGADESNGRITVDYQSQTLRYNTNRGTTGVLDSDTDTLQASLSLAVGADGDAVLQLRKSDSSFPNNPNINRDDVSVLVGFDWKVVDLITSTFRLGRSKTTLDSGLVPDSNQSTGDLELTWTPYEHAVFTANASRAISNTGNTGNNAGSFVNRQELKLSWGHQWSDEFSTDLSFSEEKDVFTGVSRQDNTDIVRLQLNYTLRRWLTVGLAFGVEDKASTDNAVEFGRNTATLSLSASL